MRHIEYGNPEAAEYQNGCQDYRDGIIVRTFAENEPRTISGNLLLKAPEVCAQADPYQFKKGRVFANVHPLGRCAYGIRFWCYADGSTFQGGSK